MKLFYPAAIAALLVLLFNNKRQAQQTPNSKLESTQAANWSPIGPNVVPTNSGGLGRINCVVFDPTNSNTMYIGTACGGIWKSTDGGATWSSNTDFLPSLSISDIAV